MPPKIQPQTMESTQASMLRSAYLKGLSISTMSLKQQELVFLEYTLKYMR